jgi:hypothetical protein
MSDAHAGHMNDPGMAIDSDLSVHVMNASLPGELPAKALADKAFGRSAFVAPLPRANMHHDYTQDQLTAISSVRVMVEWTFGEIRTTFPIVDLVLKNKLYCTKPIRMFKIAALLRNIKRCMVGSLATLFFAVQPPTLAEYLV